MQMMMMQINWLFKINQFNKMNWFRGLKTSYFCYTHARRIMEVTKAWIFISLLHTIQLMWHTIDFILFYLLSCEIAWSRHVMLSEIANWSTHFSCSTLDFLISIKDCSYVVACKQYRVHLDEFVIIVVLSHKPFCVDFYFILHYNQYIWRAYTTV